MTPTVVCLLVAFLMGAGMLVAYALGGSMVKPYCSECPHCRALALQREWRQRTANGKPKNGALQKLADVVSTAAGKRSAPRRRRARMPVGALRKILVGYDGTQPAQRALNLAIDLALTLHASLAVVSVVPHRRGQPINPWDDQEEHARQLLEARELAVNRGVDVELFEPMGEPAEEIAHAAEDGNFDAVLIGSSWTPRWIKMLQGSVAASLAAHCHKTVITVR